MTKKSGEKKPAVAKATNEPKKKVRDATKTRAGFVAILGAPNAG